jgi:glycosyltransferase involved in cell wall biosynthesis
MRPIVLLKLLRSVEVQVKYPDEIIIVDGSSNEETKLILEKNRFIR